VSLRVLVADDSILFRRVLTEALKTLPDVEVVGSVGNGRSALQKVGELRPDILTLDMEMPEMDGLAVLDALRQAKESVGVIVVSALTKLGGVLTLKALEKGAFDFITKPEGANAEASIAAIRAELAPRMRAFAHRVEIRNILAKPGVASQPSVHKVPVVKPVSQGLDAVAGRMSRIVSPGKPGLVLVGVSTGGPNALAAMLPGIPRDIGVPILVVQHMPPVFTQSLAENLSSKCAVPVCEAQNGEAILPSTVYIAPGGKQMRLVNGPDGRKTVQITDDPPENNCKPAVDYLFRSVANTFPGEAMAVILTGMGSDGTLGLRLLKRHGCFSIAQDEATSVVYGMPKAAVEAGVVDDVLPIGSIAARIVATVKGWKS
jgi:two-component system, chemotaxis family, protein-glutamate methylesterase/glutaminase